jgi:hypothetical protein
MPEKNEKNKQKARPYWPGVKIHINQISSTVQIALISKEPVPSNESKAIYIPLYIICTGMVVQNQKYIRKIP